MFSEKLSVFSRKFVYWSGLINLIALLIVAFLTMDTIVGFWALLIIIPDYFIWRKMTEKNTLAVITQIAILIALITVGVITTVSLLVYSDLSTSLLSYKYLIHLTYLWFYLSTIGIYMGVILGVAYLHLPTHSALLVMGPVTILATLFYIVVLVVYWSYTHKEVELI